MTFYVSNEIHHFYHDPNSIHISPDPNTDPLIHISPDPNTDPLIHISPDPNADPLIHISPDPNADPLIHISPCSSLGYHQIWRQRNW
jgi:hypothetical protein